MNRLQPLHIFIDTSSLYKDHFQFQKVPLKTIRDMAKSGKLVLHTVQSSNIEIRMKIRERISVALSAYKKFMSQGAILRAAGDPSLTSLFADPNEDHAAESVISAYKKFLVDCKAIEHEVTKASILDILEKYEKRLPPFENAKKHEFADALSLAVLNEWANATDQRVFVVADDNGLLEGCRLYDKLHGIRGLPALLQRLTITEAVFTACQNAVNDISIAIASHLNARTNSFLLQEDWEAEISEFDVLQLGIQNVFISDVSGNQATFNLHGSLIANADFLYGDPDTYVYDDEIGGGAYIASIHERRQIQIGVTLSIIASMNEARTLLSGITVTELNGNRPVEISIEECELIVSYGIYGPDPDDYESDRFDNFDNLIDDDWFRDFGY